MQQSGDYLVFPGGGTQFKDGVMHYVDYIEKVEFVLVCALSTRLSKASYA